MEEYTTISWSSKVIGKVQIIETKGKSFYEIIKIKKNEPGMNILLPPSNYVNIICRCR
jgi:hypothetical protein